MVHVIEALTPPEGNFASPSAIIVNGLPIQNVYYKGTLVRGPTVTGTAWPDKVVTKEDTWSVTSVSDGGRIRYAAQGSSGYRVIGLAYSVEVTKTKNELGLSGTVSCNTDGVSGYSYAMQDGSTGNNLKQQGELSQSDSVTNPSVTMSAITSGTTLPDYDGADKISSEIVASGSVRVAYTGTISSGQAEIVDPTYTASWTRRAWIGIPQANPYIQITAQEVSWERDNVDIGYNSTMRAKWSVKIKWASNAFCDLTGTSVNFAVNGRVVWLSDSGKVDRIGSSGTTTSTYTLAASTGEETITLSCSWSDPAGSYSLSPWLYAVRSKIDATVSDIPANATSSGSLAIAEKSSSTRRLNRSRSGRERQWPGGWFDKRSLSDVSTIQFLPKAAPDNVFIRVPKTITVDARIQIINPRITRSGTTLKFVWDSLIIPSITWGVKSNLSFSQDMNLFVVMRIRNKSVGSSPYMLPIHVDGTSSGSLSNLIISSGSISCEEYASGEKDVDQYTTISCYLYLNYVGRPTLSNVPLISAFETANELSADAALGRSGPVRYSSLRIDTGNGGATYVPQPLPDLSPSNASRPLWDGGLVIEGQPHPANTEPVLLSMIFDKSSLAAPSLAFLGDVNYFARWQDAYYNPTTQELTLSQAPTAIVNMLSRHGAYAYLPIVNTYDIMGVPSFTDFYIEVEFTTFIYGSWQTEPLGHLSCSGQFPLSTSALPFNYEPATGTTITGGSPYILSFVDVPDDSTVRLYVQVHYTFPDISAFPNKHIAYADTIDVWSTAVALPTQQERATNPHSAYAAFSAAATSVRNILRGTDPDNPHRGQYRVEYRR